MSDAPAPQHGRQPDADPAHDDRPGGGRREPPLVAFGIVAGTAVGAGVGLIAGAVLLSAGIGCATGVIIGAVAQALRAPE